MATYFDLTFSGSNGDKVTIMTPAVGASMLDLVGNNQKLQTYGVCGTSAAGTQDAVITNDTFPADVDVVLNLIYKGSVSGTYEAELIGRRVNSSNCYQVSITQTDLTLYEQVSGSYTSIGTASTTPTVDVNTEYRLRMSGNQISVLKAGAVVIGPITNTGVSSAGQAVLGDYGATQKADSATPRGFFFTRLQVIDVPSGGSSVPHAFVDGGAINSLVNGGLIS